MLSACRVRAGLIVIMVIFSAGTASSQLPCPSAKLPAYSHNDYENSYPLTKALELGFRGIEADVFLVDGTLRVGHDRRAAERGGTLEELYLEPLRSLVARCGTLTADRRPFLLAIEIKDSSYPTYDALLNLLARYRPLFARQLASASNAAVEAVLVGWHPPAGTLRREKDGLVRLQHRIVRRERPLSVPSTDWVRLISLDYGKTIGRPWVTADGRERWLAAVRDMKRAAPQLLIRVHNVPADGRIYAELLDAGVDLIGTKELAATRRLLLAGRDVLLMYLEAGHSIRKLYLPFGLANARR